MTYINTSIEGKVWFDSKMKTNEVIETIKSNCEKKGLDFDFFDEMGFGDINKNAYSSKYNEETGLLELSAIIHEKHKSTPLETVVEVFDGIGRIEVLGLTNVSEDGDEWYTIYKDGLEQNFDVHKLVEYNGEYLTFQELFKRTRT